MGIYPPALDRLIKALSRLPGIGPKMATRLALYVLKAPRGLAIELSEALALAKGSIHPCPQCFNLTDRPTCPICQDEARNAKQVCVVEGPSEVAAIERAGIYQGQYHVLGGLLAPLDKVGPSRLRIEELERRVTKDRASEIIIALSSTAKGEATTAYIIDLLKDQKVKITRLAFGLPFGADIEYADPNTLKASLEGRK